MKTRTTAFCLAFCCITAISLLRASFADASSPDEAPGDAQRKVASHAVSPQEPAPARSASELPGRVDALEKENLVLREDLGKARLDARTGLEQAAKRQAEMDSQLQQRIDELNAKLAAERESQARRNRNLWLAVGVLALGIIASN
jgi:hypothetical protein